MRSCPFRSRTLTAPAVDDDGEPYTMTWHHEVECLRGECMAWNEVEVRAPCPGGPHTVKICALIPGMVFE